MVFCGGVFQARPESPDGRLVGKRRLRPEIRDGHGLLQRERAGHDFAVNGTKLFVGDRPLVQAADALKHGALAVRRVNFLAGLELEFANGQHVARAPVEQPDDLRVQRVNRLAMFGNVQTKEECRIMKEESNPFRAARLLGRKKRRVNERRIIRRAASRKVPGADQCAEVINITCSRVEIPSRARSSPTMRSVRMPWVTASLPISRVLARVMMSLRI